MVHLIEVIGEDDLGNLELLVEKQDVVVNAVYIIIPEIYQVIEWVSDVVIERGAIQNRTDGAKRL
jgi:hypothetical protein